MAGTQRASRRKVSRVNYAEDAHSNSFEMDLSAATNGSNSTLDVSSGAKRRRNDLSAKDDSKVPWNWQKTTRAPEKTLFDYTDAEVKEDGKLYLADGTTLGPDDHIYVLSEPPGEPYYIGRVMEFKLKKGHEDKPDRADGVIDKYWCRVNWLYRPKDVSKKNMDSRMLYATMHCDLCPLQSLRGKITVTHLDHIDSLQEFRRLPNAFWLNQFYDRYIMRFYDLVPTEKLVNMPKPYHDLLHRQFKYVLIENGKQKELCIAPKDCQKCENWCSPDDSVTCAHCGNQFHMQCVDPPLHKKPARGFGWSCAACSGTLERKLTEERGIAKAAKEPEHASSTSSSTTPPPSEERELEKQEKPSSSSSSSSTPVSRFDELMTAFESKDQELTQEQQHQLRVWPFRYLGMHSKLEDILEIDDRIYPRAASRIGPKHQAVVEDWPGQPVEYIDPPKDQRKRPRPKNRRGGNSTAAATERGGSATVDETPERPPWVQYRPRGYIERGGATSQLLWSPKVDEDAIDDFMQATAAYARSLGYEDNRSANFIDACLQTFMECDYDKNEALRHVTKFTMKSLKEPQFDSREKQKFEEAVAKYGNELHDVCVEVGTKKSSDIVRYYYLWKKTPEGHAIWDNYEGRRKTRKTDLTSHLDANKLVDEVADDEDDSAYDVQKAKEHKRTYQCKFCKTEQCREWRRAPGHPVAGDANPVTALCLRCARLWRRYAVMWEHPETVLRKVEQKGGALIKKRLEEELIEDAKSIRAERERDRTRKRARVDKKDKKRDEPASEPASPPPPPPLETEAPLPAPEAAVESKPARGGRGSKEKRALQSSTVVEPGMVLCLVRPCAVCGQTDPVDRMQFCQHCGMNVHGTCYGVKPDSTRTYWLCDICCNDQRPLINTLYSCVCCPVRPVIEPQVTANASNMSDGLKRTTDNNWCHVRCAVWTPEFDFGDGKRLQPVEGISRVPKSRGQAHCQICETDQGICTSCSGCNKQVHVGCAAGPEAKGEFAFGFEFIRARDDETRNVVEFNGDRVLMRAALYCRSHTDMIENMHAMNEVDEATGKTALEWFCQVVKQSKLKSKGAMRRAHLLFETQPKHSCDTNDRNEFADGEMVVSKGPSMVVGTNGEYSEPLQFGECVDCKCKQAVYWFEDYDSSGEKQFRCRACHWKQKDPQAFNETFGQEPIKLFDKKRAKHDKDENGHKSKKRSTSSTTTTTTAASSSSASRKSLNNYKRDRSPAPPKNRREDLRTTFNKPPPSTASASPKPSTSTPSPAPSKATANDASKKPSQSPPNPTRHPPPPPPPHHPMYGYMGYPGMMPPPPPPPHGAPYPPPPPPPPPHMMPPPPPHGGGPFPPPPPPHMLFGHGPNGQHHPHHPPPPPPPPHGGPPHHFPYPYPGHPHYRGPPPPHMYPHAHGPPPPPPPPPPHMAHHPHATPPPHGSSPHPHQQSQSPRASPQQVPASTSSEKRSPSVEQQKAGSSAASPKSNDKATPSRSSVSSLLNPVEDSGKSSAEKKDEGSSNNDDEKKSKSKVSVDALIS